MAKQPLTERERQALTWARQHYHWRKIFGGTLEQHMATIPKGIRRDVWERWYEFPTGDEQVNEDYAIVRRLLREKRV